MRAIKVIFALSLGVTGIFGCATNERLYHRTAESNVQLPPAKSPVEIYSNSTPAPLIPQAVVPRAPEPRSTSSRNPLAQMRDAELAGQSDSVEEKPAPPAKPAVPAQPGRAFQADNRLLELLEKDLDKAVDLPAEQRRLQFSKEVIDNSKVRHFINYYSNTGKNRFRELLGRSG